MISPGDRLLRLCEHADQELLLVAPFIKANVLKKLLSVTSAHVLVRCITRWRPEEIASGVSDLEVWPLLKEREGARLWLRADLHAKYYRTGDHCLIGSANLTFAALGWSPQSNLELLVSIPGDNPEVVNFDETLLDGCVEVDDGVFEQMSLAVELLPEQEKIIFNALDMIKSDLSQNAKVAFQAWLPSLRNPEALYKAYFGDLEQLTTGSREAALLDLEVLNPPSGLPKNAFEAYIGTQLLQMPLIGRVDGFVVTPQRFGAVRDLIKTFPCVENPEFDPSRAWQTLMRWLLYFLPNRYKAQQPRHSEVFGRNHP